MLAIVVAVARAWDRCSTSTCRSTEVGAAHRARYPDSADGRPVLTIQRMALDLGCGWLHSAERNPLVALAEAEGQLVDRSEGAWYRQRGNIDFPAHDQREAWAAFRRLGERLRSDPPNQRPGWRYVSTRRSLATLHRRAQQFHQRGGAGPTLRRPTSSPTTTWQQMSTGDYRVAMVPSSPGWAPAYRWRSATNVKSVSWSNDITLETDRGTIGANAVIVTVSSTVLAERRNPLDAGRSMIISMLRPSCRSAWPTRSSFRSPPRMPCLRNHTC